MLLKSCMAEGGLKGCVVVMSSFFIQILAFGTSQSFGVYTIELLAVFKSGAAAVALVGSLNLGFFLGAGPLASLLMRRYNHRQVTLLGAILANIGLVVMPFAPNLEFMYIFYGIFGGIGYCLMFVSSFVLCGLYFPKHQSLATGIAIGGSGIGSGIFPVIMNSIIQYYGWRGSLFIISGLNLHSFVLAALLSPVPKEILRSDENGVMESLSDVSQLTLKKKIKKYFLSIFTLDFTIYCMSCICWNAATAIIFIFFPEYAYNVGLSKEHASVSYTMVGIGTGIGCVLGGIIGNFKCTDRIMLYFWANIFTGLITFLIPLEITHTLHGFIIVCTLYGISFGVLISLLVVVTSDLLGLEALGDGMGYLMLSNGIGVLGGPPIAGLLIDTYKDLDTAMFLSGAIMITGGLIIYIIVARRKFCARVGRTSVLPTA